MARIAISPRLATRIFWNIRSSQCGASRSTATSRRRLSWSRPAVPLYRSDTVLTHARVFRTHQPADELIDDFNQVLEESRQRCEARIVRCGAVDIGHRAPALKEGRCELERRGLRRDGRQSPVV